MKLLDDYLGDIISAIGFIAYCIGLYLLSESIGFTLSITGLELFLLGILIDQDKG